MWEVYSGTRPGKPARLLILSAIVLASTLGLASLQVNASRALAAERRIGDTPLVVRPPVGWLENPQMPGRFVLPIGQRGLGRAHIAIERQITFTYLRDPFFRSPRDLIDARVQRDALPFSDYRPARIGRYMGIQATRRLRVEHRGFSFDQDSVLRVACTPRGDIILIEYIPLTDLTLGDLDLLDAICRAVRIDDPATEVTPAQALTNAGLAARLPGDVCLIAARPEIPGFHVGFSENSEITHAIDVFRTWLAPGRTPRDILHDVMAGALRMPWIELPPPIETHRADGLNVAFLRNPAVGADMRGIACAALVWRNARDAALLIAHASEKFAGASERSLIRLTETLGFRDADCAPEVESAFEAGVLLTEYLTQQGPAAWWGRELSRDYLLGAIPGGWRVHVLEREALNRNPREGYRGQDWVIYPSGRETERWLLDERGIEFSTNWQGMAGDGSPTSIRMKRERENVIQHTIQAGRYQQAVRLIPNKNFISPPLELIAHAWIATQDHGEWLIETAGAWGQSLPTMRVQPMTHDTADGRRVLVQFDYDPYGVVLTFDTDHAIRSVEWQAGRFEAVSRARAERAVPALRTLLNGK